MKSPFQTFHKTKDKNTKRQKKDNRQETKDKRQKTNDKKTKRQQDSDKDNLNSPFQTNDSCLYTFQLPQQCININQICFAVDCKIQLFFISR